jgi:hypothetical protein
MRLEIEVTPDDIARGRPEESLSCPVALAIKRTTGAGLVSVDGDDIRISFRPDGSPPVLFDTPAEVVAFIDLFDEYDEGEPFRFTLDDGEPAPGPAPGPPV